MTREKPAVFTKCVANYHAAPNERIIEFIFPDGRGGLISFSVGDHPVIDIYNCDEGIEIRHKEDEHATR